MNSSRFKKPKSKPSGSTVIEPKPKPDSEPDAAKLTPKLAAVIGRVRELLAAKRKIVLIAGAAAIVLATLATVGTIVVSAKKRPETKSSDRSIADRSSRKSSRASSAFGRPAGPIAVKWPDGTQEAVNDLGEAMSKAIRDRGEVILANEDPLVFKLDKSIAVPEGRVTIRAFEGCRPVILLENAGNVPWLASATPAVRSRSRV